MAFVLVVPAGTIAPAADLAYLEAFRRDWELFFHEETETLGSMDTQRDWAWAGSSKSLRVAVKRRSHTHFSTVVPDSRNKLCR